MTLKAYRDHSMTFKGRVCRYARITCHSKSTVKLAKGKATEVHQVYLVCGVTEYDGSSWVYYSPDEGCNVLLPNLIESSGARKGDNVIFVREPGNLFDPSCVKLGFRWTSVYI